MKLLGILLLLVALLGPALTSVTKGTKFGEKSCSQGPSYWCSHIDRAKECNAVQYCMDKQWKPSGSKNEHTMHRPSADSVSCQMCKNLVKDIRLSTLAHRTMKQTYNSARMMCLLVKEVQLSHCQHLVEAYTSDIRNMVLQNKNANQICAQIGICRNSEPKSQVKHTNQIVPVSCGSCQKTVIAMKKLEQTISSGDFVKFIKAKTCHKKLGSHCGEMVDVLVPALLHSLFTKLTPYQVCSHAGHCQNLMLVRTAKPASLFSLDEFKLHVHEQIKRRNIQPRDGILCEFCEIVLDELRVLMSNNATLQEMEDFLTTKVCDKLPATEKQICEKLVVQILPTILTELSNDIQPYTICTSLRFCDGNGTTNYNIQLVKNNIELMRKSQRFSLNHNFKKNAVSGSLTKPPAADYCTTCETIVHYAETLVGKNATVKEIEDTLEKICNFLPTKIKDECDKIVVNYTPVIVQLILNDLPPQKICQLIGLCPSAITEQSKDSSKNSLLEVNKIKTVTVLNAPNDLCDTCITIVHYVETLLAANATEKEIEFLLERICRFLPQKDQAECDMIVTTYIRAILQAIVQDLPPRTACQLIQLCPKLGELDSFTRIRTQQQHAFQLKAKSHSSVIGNGLQCELCKTMVEHVEKALKENATLEEIENFLVKICRFLPSQEQPQCEYAVQHYLPAVIDLVIQKATPQEVCLILGICTNTKNHQLITKPSARIHEVTKPRNHRNKEWNNLNANQGCNICEIVVHYIDVLVGDQQTIKGINALLDKVCASLPTKDQQTECTNIVNRFTPTIVTMLTTIQPKEVCTLLGICKNSNSDHETALKTIFNLKTPIHMHHRSLSTRCHFCTSLNEYMRSNPTKRTTRNAILRDVAVICPEDPQLIKQCPANTTKVTIPSNIKKSPIQSSTTCELCTAVVTYAERFLQQNATEKEIEEVLDKICLLFPEKLKTECNDFVAKYTPALVQLLAKGLSPSTVCQFLGLCPKQQKELIKPTVSAGACDTCKLVVSYAENLLTANATVAEIEALLDKICSLFPASIRNECDSFVSQYAPELLALLAKGLSPETICQLIGLCPKQADIKVIDVMKPVAPADTCDTCKLVVSYAENLLTANSTVAEIEALLDQICSLFPTSFRTECDSFVSQYTPELLSLLAKGLSPATICQLIGLCPKQTMIEKMMKPIAPTAGACDTCKLVVSYAENLLTANATVDEIEALLDKICSLFPASFRTECDSFVSQYTPELLALLAKGLSPETICQLIGLCPKQTHIEQVMKPKAPADTCDTCKLVVTYAEQFLTANATVAEIEALLDKICSFFPDSFRSECDSFVSQYTPELLSLLAKGLSPETICQLIGLCSKTVDILPSTKVVLKDSNCDTCKTIVGYAEQFLSKNSTEEDIEHLLDMICSLFPSEFRTECDNFVSNNLPELIQFLGKDLPPEKLCQLLGFCTSARKFGYRHEHHLTTVFEKETRKAFTIASPKATPEECQLCTVVVTFIETLVTKNSTVTEIEAILDKVCNLMPVTYKTKCQEFVATYTPELLQLVATGLPPAKLCELIKLCSAATQTEHHKIVKIEPQHDDWSRKVAAPADTIDTKCWACEVMLGLTSSLKEKHLSVEQIKISLLEFCAAFPEHDKRVCTYNAERHTQAVVDMLEKGNSGEEICQHFNACAKDVSSPQEVKKPSAQMFLVSKCHDGPAFWCSSHISAHLCGAAKFCQANKWRRA